MTIHCSLFCSLGVYDLSVDDLTRGTRCSLVASDRSGELFTHELQSELEKLYPDAEVGGEK